MSSSSVATIYDIDRIVSEEPLRPSLIGTALIIGVGAFGSIGQALTAQLAIVAATICYAGAAVFGRNFRGLDPMLPAAGSLISGAVILIPGLQPSLHSLLALLALSVFSTALTFVIYFRLVQTLGSVGATAQAYLRVPIGVAIGVVFLGETLSSTAGLGLACVMAGVIAMTLPARARARQAD